MTTSARSSSRSRLLAAITWGGALTSATALTALMVIGPTGPAHAATGGYDQMTGIGETASAVTVPWTDGLLNSSNKPITTNTNNELSPNSDRGSANPTSPLSFLYPAFKKISVTVSQTQDIGHGGVTVKWTGAPVTVHSGQIQANFMQMMECYGDSPTGPSPEDCEYGSNNMLGATVTNPGGQIAERGIAGRFGDECQSGSTPSVSNPPFTKNGNGPQSGCDPYEPGSEPGASHEAPCPGADCNPGSYNIPFVPADPTQPLAYQSELPSYFDQSNSNEVQMAVTGSNGEGEQQFETLTGVQSQGLGCGELEADNQPRGCWLVIVPRGEYEPNGYKVDLSSVGGNIATSLATSPLSASNWAQRIQIHLGYAPLQSSCPIGKALVRQMAGTELVQRAVQSWEHSLNSATNCTKLYNFTATQESETTSDLVLAAELPATSSVGVGFTTIPIGSEAARDGNPPPPTLPHMVYVPVAVTGLGIGFNVNQFTPILVGKQRDGYITQQMEVSPQVLARGITQVYRQDLPDYYTGSPPSAGPAWSVKNPVNVTDDPQFQALNPEVIPYTNSVAVAPLLTADNSAENQQIWHWLQGDPATKSWLDGTPGPAGSVVADPDYTKFKLGAAPNQDNYPRDYKTCLKVQEPGDNGKLLNVQKCSLDLLPYTDSLDSAASTVLAANNTSLGTWDPNAVAADGSFGWWAKGGTQPPGGTFMWAVSDTSSLAAFGLIPALLCNDAGKNCVTPSVSSVTKALSTAKPDKTGLLHVNPANPGAGGYPFVDVVYAAVATNLKSAAINDYASLLSFAVNHGQIPGQSPGELPAGYLPLPKGLVTQANTAIAKLRAIANPRTPPSPPATNSSPGTGTPPGSHSPSPQPGSGGSGSGATPGLSPTPTSAYPGGTSGTGATSVSTSASSGPIIIPPQGSLVAATTPGGTPSSIRWALATTLIIGISGAVGGLLLRSGRLPRWMRRGKGVRRPV